MILIDNLILHLTCRRALCCTMSYVLKLENKCCREHCINVNLLNRTSLTLKVIFVTSYWSDLDALFVVVAHLL